MIDQLSRGRFQLGVGRGISPVEAGFYGIDPDQAQGRYLEALEVLLKGLTAERDLSFEGKHYKFSNVPVTLRPVQRPHPPLWYGLTSLESIAWAAANDVNVVSLALPPRARAITDLYRKTWAELGKEADKLPLMGISRHIVVAESDAAALAMARRAYPRWRASFNHLWKRYAPDAQRSPIAALYPDSFDELAALGNGFAGSPAAVRQYLADQIGASGVNYMVAWFAFGDLTVEESLRSVALFAEEVVPQFDDGKDGG